MANIDKRVVEMKFDNNAFERGVATTMNTVGKLKDSLSNLASSASSINIKTNAAGLNPLSQGVDALITRFSALQIAGVAAIANISSRAVDAGAAMAKSLTIGPISAGFSDYNAKLTSVQTIVSATGKTVEDVDVYFRELDEYADKTVFNLTDMTGALAKFTNAGVDLDLSVPAIKGIANMTALAGQGAESASIAFYNLSQSIAGGFLTTTDYKSLNLANVATKEWKDQMIAGAVAAGTLNATADGMYNIPGSDKAYNDANLFTEALSEGWASAEVLTTVLGDYGDATTDIGEKALAAAQNVKSFPMMMETLRAAVGTQWTDTFELLLGNVDEATTLFTGLTEALQTVIGASGDARNEMLTDWKEMGGRTAIIEAVQNAWTALASVVIPIKDAFRSIFPAKTGEDLANLSNRILEFTEGLILGEENMNNLKRTFRGIFAVFGIAAQLVKGVVTAIFGLFSASQGASGGLLSLTAVVGDVLYGFSKLLSYKDPIGKFFDIFALIVVGPIVALVKIIANLASAVGSLLSGDISGFKQKFFGAFSPLGDLLDQVKGKFKDFFEAISETFGTLSDFLNNLASKLSSGSSEIAVGLFTGLAKVSTFFRDFYNDAAGTLSKLIQSFTETTAKASEFFTGLAERAKSSGNSVISALATVAAKVSGFFSSLSENIEISLSRMSGSLSGAASEGGNFLNGFGSGAIERIIRLFSRISTAFQDMKAKIDLTDEINTFNSGATQAASVGGDAFNTLKIILSDVWDFIATVFTGAGDVFGPFFSGLFEIFSTVGTKIVEYVKSLDLMEVVALINTGFFILLYKALTDFAKNFGGAAKSIGGTFDAVTGSLKSMQNAVKASIILQIGAAIAILVGALFILARIDPKALAIALGALAVIFGEIAIMMKLITMIDPKALISSGIGMVALATAVLILAGAIKILGEMDPEVLKQGAIALGVLLAAMAGMAKLLTFAPGILAASAALLVLSFALVTMAGTIALYAAIPFDIVAQGIGAMVFALTGIGLAMRAFPKDMLQKSVGIAILSAALVILTGALTALGLLPLEVLIQGIISMGVMLLILAVAANAMKQALPGAAAILIMAGAISVLVPAVALLGALPMEVIGKGLLALFGIFAIFVIAMYALTPVIAVLALFSTSLLVLGLAVLVAASGFAIFVAALGALTVIGAAGFGILAVGIISLIQILPLLAQQFGYAVLAFFTVLGDIAEPVARAVGKLIMAFVNEIERRVPEMAAAGLRMIIALLEAIKLHLPEIVNLAIDIVLTFLRTIEARRPEIIQTALNFIISFIEDLAKAIRENKDRLGAAGVDLGKALFEGLVSGLTSIGTSIDKAIKDLGNSLINEFKEFFGINSPSTVFAGLGINIVEGLANGISGAFNLVKDAATKLAEKLPGWMKDVLGIESPSKVFAQIGKYSVQGLAQGLDKNTGLVKTAANSVGESAVSALRGSLEALSNITAENMDTNPTITPVFDLTDVRKGSAFLESMMDIKPVAVNASFTGAADASSAFNSNKSVSAGSTVQLQRDMQAIAASIAAKAKSSTEDTTIAPRPVEFHIGTVQDGDSLLRRARATNRMLSLAEGGDSTQLERIL